MPRYYGFGMMSWYRNIGVVLLSSYRICFNKVLPINDVPWNFLLQFQRGHISEKLQIELFLHFAFKIKISLIVNISFFYRNNEIHITFYISLVRTIFAMQISLAIGIHTIKNRVFMVLLWSISLLYSWWKQLFESHLMIEFVHNKVQRYLIKNHFCG